ncbi:MAG: LysM peptidoglycan-binding domain-containing protein [Nocardioidaceae bacterium]
MSLDRHLATVEGHARLPFRSDCPLCRAERLVGPAPHEVAAPPRVRAVVVALVLAGSSAAPAGALAQVPSGDLGAGVVQGVVEDGAVEEGDVDAPEPAAEQNALGEPDVVADTEGPDAEPPATELEQDADGAGAESVAIEPAGPSPPESAAPSPPEEQSAAAGEVPATAVPPAGVGPVAPAVPPSPTSAPAAGPSGEPPSDDEHGRSRRAARAAPQAGHRRHGSDHGASHRAVPPAPTRPAAGPAPGSTALGQPSAPAFEPGAGGAASGYAPSLGAASSAAPAPGAATVPASLSPASSAATVRRSSGGVYIVRPGDTLWSIARRLLGRRASPAAIASLVDRIWRLNADAIGTGDPDLINPGTRLLLP